MTIVLAKQGGRCGAPLLIENFTMPTPEIGDRLRVLYRLGHREILGVEILPIERPNGEAPISKQ